MTCAKSTGKSLDSMKEKMLLLCTCTYIEIITAIGVTGYLLFLGQSSIAALSAAVFLPLITFHFVLDRVSKKAESKNCNICNCNP
ncbi:MAG TPA: hypothetical protein VD731_06505 [Nitrosopumilaceae archaeon]|nr:hypothetical protein [Nitrosopumilaceae archaeon]